MSESVCVQIRVQDEVLGNKERLISFVTLVFLNDLRMATLIPTQKYIFIGSYSAFK